MHQTVRRDVMFLVERIDGIGEVGSWEWTC